MNEDYIDEYINKLRAGKMSLSSINNTITALSRLSEIKSIDNITDMKDLDDCIAQLKIKSNRKSKPDKDLSPKTFALYKQHISKFFRDVFERKKHEAIMELLSLPPPIEFEIQRAIGQAIMQKWELEDLMIRAINIDTKQEVQSLIEKHSKLIEKLRADNRRIEKQLSEIFETSPLWVASNFPSFTSEFLGEEK